MQASEFAEIKRKWEDAGRPHCDHRRRDKEYMLGGDTGDTGCMDCGELFTRAEELELRNRSL